MPNIAFSGGVAGTPPRGQRSKVRFVNTWADSESWQVTGVSTLSGQFTLGKGNIAGNTFTGAKTLRNRVYLSFGSYFAMSAVSDPTGWEEQDVGAAVIPYLSQYGAQDTVTAFASIQGRLAVFGERSIQIWGIDADPANFVLHQTLDNAGTIAQRSVQSIGDIDVMYLDSSGVRSLRAKESTLNSSVNDIGTAIDLTVRRALLNYDASKAVAIVEPTTKQYWLYLNGTIYVLSYYPESKIIAWSTFIPTYMSEFQIENTITPSGATYGAGGSVTYIVIPGQQYHWIKGNDATVLEYAGGTDILTDTGYFTPNDVSVTEQGTANATVTSVLRRTGVPFVPTYMVVHNQQVYVRDGQGYIHLYGGTDNNTYDYCPATAELPWLNLKATQKAKQLLSIDAAFVGEWLAQVCTDPSQTTFLSYLFKGTRTSATSMAGDSTFDAGAYPLQGSGTHIKIKMSTISKGPAKLGKIAIAYNIGNTK